MKKVLIFVLGAAVGSLVTWKFVEEKYKRIADEEIESVKEVYKKREDELGELVKNHVERKETSIPKRSGPVPFSELDEMHEVIENEEYSSDDEDCIVKVDNGPEFIKPYVISPDEFGEDYEMVSLMYYADGTLADDDDEIISDHETVIGDALEHFGEYEDECVHVRNDNTKIDYEILLSEKTFSEVYNKGAD